MKEEDIDRLFREAFHEAEEIPNKNVWQQIEQQLDEKKIIQIPSRKYGWIKYAAAILILASTFMLTKVIYNTDGTRQDSDAVITAQHSEAKPDTMASLEQIEQLTIQEDADRSRDDNKKDQTVRIASINLHELPESKTGIKEASKRNNIEIIVNDLEETKPMLTGLGDFHQADGTNIPVRQVTEIEDIKPLIDLDEETESMYAQAPHETSNKNIVTSILNSISEKLEVSPTKDIRFRADEEGSLRIDILNSLVKNRNKKK